MEVRVRISLKLLLVIMIIIGFSYFESNSKQISADILQFKHNRIYLNIGSEELIYPDYRFWMINKSDTILAGRIETVYEGISISYQTENEFLISELDKYDVIVETAEIDSSRAILISYPELSEFEISNIINAIEENKDYKSNYGNIFKRQQDIDFDHKLEPNEIRISYVKNENIKTKAIPAPFISAIIPNLSKKINRDGILTTSIYYIYNDKYLPSIAERETVEVDCFWNKADCVRAYNRDSAKGKELLKRLKENFSKVQISYFDNSLKLYAEYIADILAQERIMVDISKDNLDADLFLKYIQYDITSPTNAIVSIIDFLNGFKITNPSYKETVSIFNSYIEKMTTSDSSINKEHFYNIIDYGLKYDLSVFPLFQPSIYISYGAEIIYKVQDHDSKFDLGNFTTILPPQTNMRESQ